MKTRISQITAIALFALIILVGNVNAKGTELVASNHENIEIALELENWMTNANFWDTEDNMVIETANEATLELESWMTNKNIWELENQIKLETETEQILTFEPWMTNKNTWNR